MSNKATMRIGAGADTIKRTDRRVGRSIGRESQAQRGAELEFVRTAGPRSIAEMLARLEARGEIVANNDVSADEKDFDLDGAADVELDLQDEDLAQAEVWQQPGNLVGNAVERVPSVRLCDGFAPRRLGSATTKRSGDSNEIEPVILVGY